MIETLEKFQTLLAAAGIALFAAMAFAPLLFRACAEAWDRSRANRFARFAFLAAAVGLTLYGGAKQKTGSISYPYTDVEQRYLSDAGSYVTNDAVHVAFTRIIVPSSAPLLIDRRELSKTNDTDWVSFTNTTFAAFANPCDIPFPAATNFDWVVYTTWTPGPTVTTNGVWHAFWGTDHSKQFLIPVRTCVRENGTVIATPKSVWNATNGVNTTTTGQKINSMTIKDMEAYK